ncbi:hypothetical protein [Nocardia sp. NPDC056100]|uniref:hypothetical protein n=1 Tax=Nocardia sp. NPDC056100 TaxID=3345712 RepID=UPI0035D627A0
MNGSDCVPLITPIDCGPATAIPPTTDPPPAPSTFPPLPAEAPPGTPSVVRDVTDPVVHHSQGIGYVGDVAETALVCGAVLTAMLVLIVAVAATKPLEPHRLRNFAAAAWVLPLASAAAGGSWSTPLSLLWEGAEQLAAGHLGGLSMMLVLGLPATMLAASLWWAHFLIKTDTVGVKSLRTTKRIQDSLTERRRRAATRAAQRGAPLHHGRDIVLGTLSDKVSYKAPGLWRTWNKRYQPWFAIAHKHSRMQQVLLGMTGSGKTELIKRYSIALFDYEWRAWQRWAGVPAMAGKHLRPLLAILSCKGGEDDIAFGKEMRAAVQAQGIDPERIAVVAPGMDRLDIWTNTPARDLRAIVAALIDTGDAATAEGQHFEEMRTRIAYLVVDAPIGPPRSSTEFLERLDGDKLKEIWNHAPDVVRQVEALQAEKVPQIDDALIKCTNLIEQLKDHNGNVIFDGGRDINDLDFLFVTVPALDKDAARAQISAVLRLLMQRAGRTVKALRRSVILFLDELSALTTKKGSIPIEDVAERGRSQGVAGVFCGQAPESIAADQWALNRFLKTCAGGVLLGYMENAGELCKHFGSIPVMLPTRHLIKGQRHGDEGQVSVGEKWLADPDRIRQFDTGDFVFVKGGYAYYGHIVPLDRNELTVLPGTHADPEAAVSSPAAGGTGPAPAAA